MLRALVAVVSIVCLPSVAYPCGGIYYGDADRSNGWILARQEERWIPSRERESAATAHQRDALAIAKLRQRGRYTDISWIVSRFEERVEAAPRNVRLWAWLAEAYVAAGLDDRAWAILGGLVRRDLMPDAHAFLAYAEVTKGAEREESLATCKRRASAKGLCTLANRIDSPQMARTPSFYAPEEEPG